MDCFTFNIYDMNTELENMSLEIIENFRLKHEELKRLQKEIDEAEKQTFELITNLWGKEKSEDERENYDEKGSDLYELIKSNQSKIKQLIEEL